LGPLADLQKEVAVILFSLLKKNTRDIVNNLRNGNFPNPKLTFRNKMFQWYGKTLLEVLISGQMTGKEIFSIIFRKLHPANILSFLGNESSIKDDIKIRNSLPKAPFLMAELKQLK
jgi:lycopene beta-cyclase